MEEVILVDERDNELGVMEKLKAHKLGLLHRALSIFVFNDKKELLLQQRAADKYHSANLWSNTCCSHPRPNELPQDAANRRLMEEMGMQCELHYKFNFVYNATLENKLIEHELDYVFVGTTNVLPAINRAEVSNWRYVSLDNLTYEINTTPELFTEWFKICFSTYYAQIFAL
ncbi:MAG: isopentenyl-diphosphate Delta-isomerase [Bacteroidia bacterium]|nr:isopentenyl-diphosphate Delta-isomerase [Bacteroidia bacterium]